MVFDYLAIIFLLFKIINVIASFIVVSTTLYYIFVEIQREGETLYIRIGSYAHWEFVHISPIIMIVAICNWTSNQVCLPWINIEYPNELLFRS